MTLLKKESLPEAKNHSSTTLTNSYSTRERLLSSLTTKVAGWVTSTRPHLSTASLMDPLNMSIFAFRRIKVDPGVIKSTAQQ
ncbi:hypothetical protein Lal_00034320 [Lupinus albus]|nr:hypothetical protein Lal_00034320 [Lupinus albus]